MTANQDPPAPSAAREALSSVAVLGFALACLGAFAAVAAGLGQADVAAAQRVAAK